MSDRLFFHSTATVHTHPLRSASNAKPKLAWDPDRPFRRTGKSAPCPATLLQSQSHRRRRLFFERQQKSHRFTPPSPSHSEISVIFANFSVRSTHIA